MLDRHKKFQDKLREQKNKPMFYGYEVVIRPKPKLPSMKRAVQKFKQEHKTPVSTVDAEQQPVSHAECQNQPPHKSHTQIPEVKKVVELPPLLLPKLSHIANGAPEFISEIDSLGPRVYKRGNHNKRRIKMSQIGLDIGTKTIVAAYKNGKNIEYITEINGYWPIERSTPFIENMLSDPKKKRSDGTERPARFIKLEDGRLIILGRDAEEFVAAAFSMTF